MQQCVFRNKQLRDVKMSIRVSSAQIQQDFIRMFSEWDSGQL